MNKYPIYIPSLGRVENHTTKLLNEYSIPYKIFVEEKEYKDYESYHGTKNTICLDGSNFGGAYYVRNFMKSYGIKEGHEYHWEIDDDIKEIYMLKKGQNTVINPSEAFFTCEKFVNKYTNIGIAGLSANTFVKWAGKPFVQNTFAYTCFLLNHSNNFVWRNLEEDLDYNLQCLTNDWCTIRFNIYNFKWNAADSAPGGYTELRTGNQRLERFKNTMKVWPIIPGIDSKSNGKYRLKTEGIWKNFKKTPKLKLK